MENRVDRATNTAPVRRKTQEIIIRGTRATNDKDRSDHGYRWNSATICGVLSIDRFRLVACLLLNTRALSIRSARKHGDRGPTITEESVVRVA